MESLFYLLLLRFILKNEQMIHWLSPASAAFITGFNQWIIQIWLHDFRQTLFELLNVINSHNSHITLSQKIIQFSCINVKVM